MSIVAYSQGHVSDWDIMTMNMLFLYIFHIEMKVELHSQ